MGKRELVALLNLSSWCLLLVERLFLAVPRGCLRFVIVVFPVHTHLIFFTALTMPRLNFGDILQLRFTYISPEIRISLPSCCDWLRKG